jgi:mono/diheme cytochrome c family protein
VNPKLIVLLVAVAVVPLLVAVAWDAGLFASRHPTIPQTPEAIAHGRRVFAQMCVRCHTDVPLERRLAGWTADRAYEAIGRLPQIAANMPPFPGTEEERRALAAYLATLGAGRPTR